MNEIYPVILKFSKLHFAKELSFSLKYIVYLYNIVLKKYTFIISFLSVTFVVYYTVLKAI